MGGRNLWEDGEEQFVTVALKEANAEPECVAGQCVFIDDGQAFGYDSILSHRVAPNLLVHGFNPSSRFVRQVADNLIVNRIRRGICIHQVALSDKNTTNGYIEYGAGASLQTLGKGERVRVTSLDTFVGLHVHPRNYKVAVVKLDIEGSAGLALRGASDLIASRQVMTFFIGIHTEAEYSEAASALEAGGYSVTRLVKFSGSPNSAIIAKLHGP